MRILITGATGFVGRHVVKVLQNHGYELALFVRNIDGALNLKNPDTVFIKGDLGNLDATKNTIQKFEPEVCIHLAWEGIPDYSADISKTNLDNSINFLNFIAKETDCRKIIISGSCFEYGKTQGDCKESDNVQTTSFFGWAKQSIYNYASLLCEQSAIDLVWFRIFYVYGPCQRSGSLIPTLVQALRNEKQPDIRSQLNKNDFIYVEDVAKAFQLAAVTGLNTGIYNLGCGYSVSVYDACKIAENYILGSSRISNDIIHIGSKSESIDFWADMEKTTSTLNWTPNITFEQGVAKYIESIKNEKRQ